MKRRKFLYATLLGAGLSASCNGGHSRFGVASDASSVVVNEPLKVGFVYFGTIDDFGWTYAHDLGRREMEVNLQARVRSTFIENVRDAAGSEKVIKQLAEDGHKLIFTTSIAYTNITAKMAASYPHAIFENCAGYKRATNLGTYLGRFEEPRYLSGAIAGYMTKSNLIGFIAAYPIPSVIRSIGAFTQGVRLTNPQAQVKVVWLQNWYNPVMEREKAIALIESGADVLTHHSDSATIVQVAAEKGVYACGFNADLSRFGPQAHLVSAVNNWGKFYTDTALAVINGTWEFSDVWDGIASGMVDISPINTVVPPEIQQLVNSLRQQLIAGTVHPFVGPVKDQSGKLQVRPGEVLSDREQLKMDWLVEGVLGNIPEGK